MSAAAHTPGPWDAAIIGSERGHELAVLADSMPASDGGRPQAVCVVSPVPLMIELDRANARLIAAAPDMLAAIKHLSDVCESTIVEFRREADEEVMREAWRKVEAAIRLAETGERA